LSQSKLQIGSGATTEKEIPFGGQIRPIIKKPGIWSEFAPVATTSSKIEIVPGLVIWIRQKTLMRTLALKLSA
jgi:hypothetical protein